MFESYKAAMRANFTRRSCLAESAQPVDLWGRNVDPEGSDEDEAYRLLMPLNALCGLIERMRLDGQETSMHRLACEALMAHLLRCCRSASVELGLLDAIRGVHARDDDLALASLRAIAA
jgi:hypothetical protein